MQFCISKHHLGRTLWMDQVIKIPERMPCWNTKCQQFLQVSKDHKWLNNSIAFHLILGSCEHYTKKEKLDVERLLELGLLPDDCDELAVPPKAWRHIATLLMPNAVYQPFGKSRSCGIILTIKLVCWWNKKTDISVELFAPICFEGEKWKEIDKWKQDY